MHNQNSCILGLVLSCFGSEVPNSRTDLPNSSLSHPTSTKSLFPKPPFIFSPTVQDLGVLDLVLASGISSEQCPWHQKGWS